MSFPARIGSLVSGVFQGPNGKWDLGRILGAKACSAYTFAFLYAEVHLKAVPDWSALGIGYTGVLGGIGLLIGAKDMAVAKANATGTTP